MKKYLDVRNIVITILVVIALLEFLNPKGFMPNRTEYMTKVDSIPYAVHDTVVVDSLVEVEVEVPVEIEIPVERLVYQPVDTAAILKDFYARNEIKEILTLPNNMGTINLNEIISENKVSSRTFTTNVKPIVKVDTVYTPEPRKNQVYYGVNGGLNKVDVFSHVGLGIMLKTKDEKIYQLGVGVSNRVIDGTNGTLSPYINAGVYWKIKLKK